jgi:hypothetical protein
LDYVEEKSATEGPVAQAQLTLIASTNTSSVDFVGLMARHNPQFEPKSSALSGLVQIGWISFKVTNF